ncbi:hypothetical protein RRG08_037963 [Elysia crispata]|uniref:Uncharacterized protein n=1 Tax=Elysia crispata TaxID=231223 RepID=A0AAE1DVX5_9GAST|nr:hypothetical protein RRG08_037963 [Elysia crispata]
MYSPPKPAARAVSTTVFSSSAAPGRAARCTGLASPRVGPPTTGGGGGAVLLSTRTSDRAPGDVFSHSQLIGREAVAVTAIIGWR